MKAAYPIKVNGERVWRTYLGGRELDKLHGAAAPADSHFPEEWMLSTTKASNAGREELEEGLCRVADLPGTPSLKELIEADPQELLGARHYDTYGPTMGVLIKLIDSLERLTVQVHPDRETAMRLFQSRFGKTECWHILGVRDDSPEEACLYMGFRQGITRAAWEDSFHQQDYPRMLSMMNRIPVKTGETYIIHGGVPHAIGAGCFIMEIQEPTDYTIRIEKVTPSGFVIDESMCHQGLGFERMFECFDYTGRSEQEALSAWRLEPKRLSSPAGSEVYALVDYGVTDCFAMERIRVETASSFQGDGAFACFYVLGGSGELSGGGQTVTLSKGTQVFLPAACASYTLRADGAPLELLRCHGPKA